MRELPPHALLLQLRTSQIGWHSQVVGRPFKFSRILRIVRYIGGLQTLASTIASALPATLQVCMSFQLAAHGCC